MDSTHRVLVFDIWGNYARFRRFYTTSSPLTFPFPPRTTVAGLIAAIIGLGRDEYLPIFRKQHATIGVRIINPIKKMTIALNLINTKDNYVLPVQRGKHFPRSPTRIELIKDCKYRIYFTHTDPDLYDRVKTFLAEHKSVYTPYLGASEYLGNFRFIGERNAHERGNNGFIELDSVVPMNVVDAIEFNHQSANGKQGEYFTTTIPVDMEPDRTVDEYADVVYERNGYPVKAKVATHWELAPHQEGERNGIERICFL